MSKKPSGAQNRKRKAKEDTVIDAMRDSILNFVQDPISSTTLSTIGDNSSEIITSNSQNELLIFDGPNVEFVERDKDEPVNQMESHDITNLNDPSTWETPLNLRLRDSIVKYGPHQVTEYDFPKNCKNRKFTSIHYKRILPNGEAIQRRWLVYSIRFDSIICFCCKLFQPNTTLLTGQGFKDWSNISAMLKEHESSNKHIESYLKWHELEVNLNKHEGIDSAYQNMILIEIRRWRQIFERLLGIVQFLAQHNMAFRGSSERLYEVNNGNFLGLVELFAKFDPVLADHVKRVISGTISDHYLGKNIQNELIQLMSCEVKKVILTWRKSVKYFSLILDCTPDLAHTEQMSLIIRIVNYIVTPIRIEEHFLGFLPVYDTTGLGLTETVLNELQTLNIDIMDCRGQGYDNGSNMKGNKRAFFVPCGCHSLNLVISDAAKSSAKTITLFGIIQRTFVLFPRLHIVGIYSVNTLRASR